MLKLLRYEFVDNMLEKRKPYREAHLQLAKKQVDEGKLLMAGAIGETAKGGMSIFKDTTEKEIASFARRDPYVINGLVTNWTIESYTVAEGTLKDS